MRRMIYNFSGNGILDSINKIWPCFFCSRIDIRRGSPCSSNVIVRISVVGVGFVSSFFFDYFEQFRFSVNQNIIFQGIKPLSVI